MAELSGREAGRSSGPSATFYAEIRAEGGRVVGHVPICNREAGDFVPVEPDGFELALSLDGERPLA